MSAMKLDQALAMAEGRLSAALGASFADAAVGLLASDFDLPHEEVAGMACARGAFFAEALPRAINEIPDQHPADVAVSLLAQVWLEGLLTGLLAPGTRPSGNPALEIQEACERHLDACMEALEDPELPSPACAPFCGCQRCEVREVLWVACERIEAAIREGKL